MDSQHLDYPEDSYYYGSHSTITPAYNLLIAFASSFLGCSTYSMAQYVVAAISLTTIVGAYLIALRMTSSPSAAFIAASVLALFGTFVFLTGSSWKLSLGVAVLILLIYSYVTRNRPHMLALMTATLLVLPIVHHFVAATAYLSLWFLTILSIVFAVRNRMIRRRHLRDLAVLSFATSFAYVYYALNSLDRLETFAAPMNILFGIVLFALIVYATHWFLTKKSRISVSLAPVPATAIFVIFALDYFNPFLGYDQGSPPFVFLTVFSMSVVVGFGWYGIETLVEANNRYRAVPIGLLMPIALVIAYALLMESGYWSHWMIYRSFDFADVPLALGIGSAAKVLLNRQVRRQWLMILLLCSLLISFPFSYWTGPLTGVRHDTQYYEYDAVSWTNSNLGGGLSIRSDERISYTAQALYDIIKDPYLPKTLSLYETPQPGRMNLLLEEWFTVGVDDYPRGHQVLDEDFAQALMSESDVLYVGGPSDNKIIGFMTLP